MRGKKEVMLFGPGGGVLVWVPGSRTKEPRKCCACRVKLVNAADETIHMVVRHGAGVVHFQFLALENKVIENAKA